MRRALGRYLWGSGIEIGALHRPMNLTGLAIMDIRYVDRCSEDDLYRMYPELQAFELTPVDVVDNGEMLTKIGDESVDFIIANHFIEHTRNPIGTLENWLAKLRQGGIIFLTVPDKDATFDRERPLTPLQHLIDDYHATPEERHARDRQHFEEWATFIDKLPSDEIAQRVNFLIEIDYSIHFHTFKLQSFLAIIHYLVETLRLPLQLVACADTLSPGDEFILVLRRL